MDASLKVSQQRLDKNAQEEKAQKDHVLQDLTDSIYRVITGKPNKAKKAGNQA